MSVKLREKQMKNGQISFYLDIYHNKTRWYEFLDIHINKNRMSHEDKEKKRLATEIRVKKEHELIADINNIQTKSTYINCLVNYFELYCLKNNNSGNRTVLNHIKKITKGAILPFGKITPQWLKNLEQHFMKIGISNNTTLHYMLHLNGVLNAAVRDKLLKTNPYHEVPKAKRLRMQDIYRTSYTETSAKLSHNFFYFDF